MAFFLRTLCAVIGAAFLFAVANLFVSGLPANEGPVAVASDRGPSLPGRLRDLAAPLLGEASPQPISPVAPSARVLRTPPAQISSAPSALALRLETDWRAWMAANGLTEGSMAVLMPNGTAHHAGVDRAAEASAPVASLSKAITGICMDIVLREQGLGWYTSLGDIASQMSDVRVTPQPWNAHITLASLANHTSGLAPDLTQGTMGSDLHGALGLHRRIASEALREENMQGTRRDFFYNNTNYAVLGVAIEALTGQTYAEACMDRVIAPSGVTDAVIHGRMGSRSSYGGWEMSADSYARVAQHWFSAGNEPIDRPFDRPMHNNYALGYQIEGRGIGAHTSHSGRFCYSDTPNVGSYFHARGDGVVFAANWTGPACISTDDTGLPDLIRQAMQ